MIQLKKSPPKPGTRVVLTQEPPHLLHGLPDQDQAAIREIIGKPVLLVAYDGDGRAELEFADRRNAVHFIYVDPVYIKPAR